MRALATLLLLLTSCEKEADINWDGITSFRVALTSGDPGTAEDPVSSSPDGLPFSFSIRAIDGNGTEMKDFDGTVQLSVEPGSLTDDSTVEASVSGGRGEGSVDIARSFGPTHIWVEDVGAPDAPGSFATGISETIYFHYLRLRDIQQSTSTLRSPFEGERPIIRDARMVVTRVISSGFFVTDIEDVNPDDPGWNAMYVYSYSLPEGVDRGDVVVELAGNVQEFYGLTEMTMPDWVLGGTEEVPTPQLLDCEEHVASGGLDMERWESNLVEVHDAVVRVCDGFPTCPDLDGYGQWMIELPCGGELNVITIGLSIDPVASVNQSITKMVAILRQHQYARPTWILEPRDSLDICCPTCVPAHNDGC